MRELKYRVWSVNDRTYDDPYSHSYYAMTQDGELDFYCHGDHWNSCDPDKYIIEQYTGLKDKNGKEIYEGDIIKARDWDGDWGKYRIKWKQSHCAFEAFECRKHGKWNWTLQGFGGIEVIGNIHENPELLGGKE